jgi:pimeloyl-ACP methyl ester carboxylesterase
VRRLRKSARELTVAARRRVPFGGDRFRLGLEDPRAPLASDMDVDSGTLLLAFGGMAGKLDIPPFEFFSLTGEMPVKRLFVRDLRRAWYHRGVPRHGETIPAVAASLAALIERQSVERLVVVGTSAGGYAALLFGSMLGAETVLSFCPQTTLDRGQLAAIGDQRWDEQLGPIRAAGELDEEWADLRRRLPQLRRAETAYELYYDGSFELDRLQAEHLDGLPGVSLRPFDGGRHLVARAMRESGDLEWVLTRALALPGPAEA